MLQINACRLQSDERRCGSFDNLGLVPGVYLLLLHQQDAPINSLVMFSNFPRISSHKQLLADVDEHDVGIYSALGR